MRPFIVCALALAFGAAPAGAQQPPAPDLAGWREDLRILAREVPARHPNAFAQVTRTQWDSAVASLEARLPNLSRNQILIELFLRRRAGARARPGGGCASVLNTTAPKSSVSRGANSR